MCYFWFLNSRPFLAVVKACSSKMHNKQNCCGFLSRYTFFKIRCSYLLLTPSLKILQNFFVITNYGVLFSLSWQCGPVTSVKTELHQAVFCIFWEKLLLVSLFFAESSDFKNLHCIRKKFFCLRFPQYIWKNLKF